jgi:hypothetical protein
MRAPDSKLFMKITLVTSERGSVLVTALITITIITFICATSLYVASQNTHAGMQSASWQQALSGAESAIDQAFNALNLSSQSSPSAWTGWKSVKWNSLPTLPTTQPSPSGTPFPSATATPAPGYLNYYIPNTLNFSTGTEGNNSVSSWVTIDTTAPSPAPSPLPLIDNNANQCYRVRATGSAGVPGRKRVSNSRLDNDLRKLSLIFDRKAGGTVSSPVASRTIEVIAAPQTKNVSAYGIMLRNSINMQGNTLIDSFNSVNGPYNLVTNHQSHANVATANSTGSNLHNEPIKGSLAYSGPPIQGTGGVTGTISTPFNWSPPNTSNPSWTPSATYTGVPGSNSFNANATPYVKIAGDFIVNGAPFSILGSPGSSIEIWVTGQFQTTSTLIQSAGVHVKWYVDGNITTGGGSYVNSQGLASYTTFIGVGTGTVSISGNTTFIAAVNAPGYNMTIGGTGDFIGSLAGNSLNMIGSGSIHYDEALASLGTSSSIANYAIASWFEDNSDPSRGLTY